MPDGTDCGQVKGLSYIVRSSVRDDGISLPFFTFIDLGKETDMTDKLLARRKGNPFTTATREKDRQGALSYGWCR